MVGHAASVNDLSVTFGDLVVLQKDSDPTEAMHAELAAVFRLLKPWGAKL
jgi:hypothetical protein